MLYVAPNDASAIERFRAGMGWLFGSRDWQDRGNISCRGVVQSIAGRGWRQLTVVRYDL
jgi:hypothetical protein